MATHAARMVTLIVVFFYSSTSFAQQEEAYRQWSEQADAIYTLVREEQFAEAREGLTQLARSFSKTNQELSPIQLQILSDQMIDMDRELTRLSVDWERMHFSALRLRLAFDALSHRHQPLWHQYQGSIKKSLVDLQGAMRSKNEEQLHASLDRLAQNFELIQPALLMVYEPTAVNQAESQVKKIEESWENRGGEELQEELQQLESALDSFFLEDSAVTAEQTGPPSMAVILWAGGIIAFVLTYVGWRKYRGEQMEGRHLQKETL